MRGRRIGDLSPLDIDRMRESSDAAAIDRHLAEQDELSAEWEAREEHGDVPLDAFLEEIAPDDAG